MAVPDVDVSSRLRVDGIAVVTVVGDLDLDTCAVLEACLTRLVWSRSPKVALDLDGVSYLDCSTVRLLIGAHTQAGQAGGWVRLARARTIVLRLFEVTNTTRTLALYDTVDSAVKDTSTTN
ncbi:STAS domain-containing protein [Peterkaempfera sp. SMS 1(5)a]|uniref:STAS domain-containing protein n=1 Tax=Peterkaempfera podocarpi TaxID=3232308 RepID=UPI003672EA91